jgi:hypothetical protein
MTKDTETSQKSTYVSPFAQKGKVKRLSGSVLNPGMGGLRLVLHFAGDMKDQSDKLYQKISAKWTSVDLPTKKWFANRYFFKPGCVNVVNVRVDTWVLQTLVRDKDGVIDQGVIKLAITNVAKEMKLHSGASLHVSDFLLAEVPGLEQILEETICSKGMNVYLYDGDFASEEMPEGSLIIGEDAPIHAVGVVNSAEYIAANAPVPAKAQASVAEPETVPAVPKKTGGFRRSQS